MTLRLFVISLDDFFYQWDEQYHALVAKNLAENPLKPMLYKVNPLYYDPNNWTGNTIWLHKQPFFLWQIALSIKLFGATAFAVKLPSAVMSAILIPITYRMGKIAVNAKVGYFAALIYASNFYLLEFNTGGINTDHNDVAFIFYVTMSFWAFLEYRTSGNHRYVYLIGVFAGVAILTKWLTGLLVFGGWGLGTLIYYKENFKTEFINIIKAFGTAVAIALPWQVYILMKFPAESRFEYAGNSAHFFHAVESHGGDWAFYWTQALAQFGIVETCLLIVGVILLPFFIKDKRIKIGIVASIVATYLFFTVAATKMPAFCLIVAPLLFIAFGNLLVQAIDWLTKYLKHHLIQISIVALCLSAVFVSGIKIDEIQARHVSKNNWYRTQQQNAAELGRMMNSMNTDEKIAVINCNESEHIHAMFFAPCVAYVGTPSEKDYKILKDQGYRIYYADKFVAIPDHVKKDPTVLYLPNVEKGELSRQIVNLKASNGKFLCADQFQSEKVVADRESASDWERFNLYILKNNECIIGTDNNKFLCVDLHRNASLYGDRSTTGDWETFTFNRFAGDTIVLTGVNGKYVSLDPVTKNLTATATSIGQNEKFKMIIKARK